VIAKCMLLMTTALLALAGSAAHAENRTSNVVILHTYGMQERAKSTCKIPFFRQNDPAFARTCDSSPPEDQAAQFGRALRAEFATTEACQGVVFGEYKGSFEGKLGEIMKGPHWFLTVDFTVGETKHSWEMVLRPVDYTRPDTHVRISQTRDMTAHEIAIAVCSAVAGRGAKLVQ